MEIRNRFYKVFQNIHFGNNLKNDKWDKAYKTQPPIDQFNTAYQAPHCNADKQSLKDVIIFNKM